MTHAERQVFLQCLDLATAELKQAIKFLDDSEHKCSACKMNVHHNQDEWKAHVELTAALGKLQKWRAELDFPKMVPLSERTTR